MEALREFPMPQAGSQTRSHFPPHLISTPAHRFAFAPTSNVAFFMASPPPHAL